MCLCFGLIPTGRDSSAFVVRRGGGAGRQALICGARSAQLVQDQTPRRKDEQTPRWWVSLARRRLFLVRGEQHFVLALPRQATVKYQLKVAVILCTVVKYSLPPGDLTFLGEVSQW